MLRGDSSRGTRRVVARDSAKFCGLPCPGAVSDDEPAAHRVWLISEIRRPVKAINLAVNLGPAVKRPGAGELQPVWDAPNLVTWLATLVCLGSSIGRAVDS